MNRHTMLRWSHWRCSLTAFDVAATAFQSLQDTIQVLTLHECRNALKESCWMGFMDQCSDSETDFYGVESSLSPDSLSLDGHRLYYAYYCDMIMIIIIIINNNNYNNLFIYYYNGQTIITTIRGSIHPLMYS